MKCPCTHDQTEPFHRESWQRKWNAAFDKLPKHLQDEILRDPKGKAAHNFNQLLMKRNPVKRKKMGSPWRFVKGAKPGFRKLKNIRTGKVRLIRMGARKAGRRHRGNPSSMSDSHAAHELALFGLNDRDLYFKGALPIIASLSKKIRKGTYHPELALKFWGYHAERAAKKYAQEFASPSEWNTIFTAATRRQAAKEFADHYEEELRDEAGNKRNPVTVRKLGSGAYRVRGERRKIHAYGTTKARATRQARLIRAVEHGWRPTGRPAFAVRKKLKAMRKPTRAGHRLFAHRKGKHWTLRTAPRGGLVIAKHLTLEQLRSRARKLSYKIRSL